MYYLLNLWVLNIQTLKKYIVIFLKFYNYFNQDKQSKLLSFWIKFLDGGACEFAEAQKLKSALGTKGYSLALPMYIVMYYKL